ncbi:MAG TPA: hypothetical protein VIW03_18160 [Anaeromyxobacter sp.]
MQAPLHKRHAWGRALAHIHGQPDEAAPERAGDRGSGLVAPPGRID